MKRFDLVVESMVCILCCTQQNNTWLSVTLSVTSLGSSNIGNHICVELESLAKHDIFIYLFDLYRGQLIPVVKAMV